MTSRECVIRAIDFKKPDRIPLCVNFNYGLLNSSIRDEVLAAIPSFQTDIMLVYCGDPQFVPEEEGMNQWGYRYESLGETMGEVTNPPIKDWSQFDAWLKKAPDFSHARRYDTARAARLQNPDKFLIGGIGLIATEMINLRGFGASMEDLYLERGNVERMLDVLYSAAKHAVNGYASAGIDAVLSWEDWGLQDRAMVDPKLWREIFFDRMKELVALTHSHGMKYVLHSCGYILDYMDMFIELGIDVIQQDQQLCMGFDKLSKWRGKICFMNPVDVQHSPKMDDGQITEYAHRMAQALGSEDGGFIYMMYASPAAIGMPARNIVSEIRGFKSITI